ncbi:hypothetical protein CEXT_271821 [Caerostris extrusa]|uniref:Uncharacterized protein n=1 Tax=Caerostris extrusa TaxID=172846 RepID=A0AAV4NN87_CAEEX|nr:hypothetical protein CEXT_271821 [Caerostris extrusa]
MVAIRLIASPNSEIRISPVTVFTQPSAEMCRSGCNQMCRHEATGDAKYQLGKGKAAQQRLTVTKANTRIVQQDIQQKAMNFQSSFAAQAELRRMATHRFMCYNIHLFPYKNQI